MRGTGIKKNLAYSIVYQLLTIILPLITAPYVTRVLGAKNLGIYSTSQALAHYFLLFAMLGLNNYGNRAIARVRNDQAELNRTFWEIYLLQLGTASISLILYALYCVFLLKENTLIYLMQSFYVLSGLIDINWCCFGLEKFKLTTLRSMGVRIVTAILVFVLIKGENDLWIYTFLIASSYILTAILVWPFVLRAVKFVWPSWKGIKSHIKPNLVLFWPVIAVSVYNIMDKLMLGWYSEAEEVAFYTYAERIVTIPTTVILALDNVVMPRMSNMFATNDDSGKIQKLMDMVMQFAMLMAAPMCFGLAGVANVFAPWFYGQAFVRCGYFILLLCPVIVIKAWAGALRTQFIIPTGRDKIYVMSLTAGAIVNFVLNLLLIPKLNGVGAIIGTLAAEFAVCFIQFFKCRNSIPVKKYISEGFCFCIMGFVMFIIVWNLSDISKNSVITLVSQIVVGAVVYTILACFYLIKIIKTPVLINEGLKILHIKYRFR